MKTSSSVLLAVLAAAANVNAQTLVQVVVDSDAHATLEAAVLAASPSIATALSDASADLTLFAPDDAAFGTLGTETVTRLVSPPWQQHLDCVLLGHVYGGGAVASSSITSELTVDSLQEGYQLTIAPVDGMVKVNGLTVSAADIAADNGVIHSMSDGVLLPSCVTANIAEQLTAAGNFGTLLSLVTAAGLVDAVTGAPTMAGLTLFAPNDAAFAKVPTYIVEFLTANTDVLAKVLTFHVAGAIAKLEASGELTALFEDDKLSVMVADGMTKVQESTVTKTHLASNGIIYELDTVMIPPSLVSALPEAPASTDDNDMAAASSDDESSAFAVAASGSVMGAVVSVVAALW